jgi:hypothetical protein
MTEFRENGHIPPVVICEWPCVVISSSKTITGLRPLASAFVLASTEGQWHLPFAVLLDIAGAIAKPAASL